MSKPEFSARFRLGGIEIAALSDGVGEERPADWFPGVPDPAWMRAVGVTDPSATLPVNFGSFLAKTTTRTVLIDTGNGPRTRGRHPGAAGLIDQMAKIGVLPGEIDTVLLTHFHGDHVGWNTDEPEGGALTFPNAVFWLHEADLRHLDRPEAETKAGDRFSRAKLWPLRAAGRLESFAGENSPLPGFTFLPTPGHTPGHCSIIVESQGERLFIVGDAAPHTAHLEHPDWTTVFDLDPAGATASRRVLANRAIRERALVTGGHFPIPTVGRLRADGEGYHWTGVALPRLDAASNQSTDARGKR